MADDFAGFPPTQFAREEPNGLLAAGGDLKPDTLLHAYSRGIFPWFNEDDPLLWWTPSPRCVLMPNDIHISKSLRKHLKRCAWQVSIDRSFVEVMTACAELRQNTETGGTWISAEMIEAYSELHALGFAHSIEVWEKRTLVGGLYGVSLGRVFFGESMFSLANNGSKTALAHFAQWAHAKGFALIDCQVENPHLQSLGAKTIDRSFFEQLLLRNISASQIEAYQQIWQDSSGMLIEVEI